MIFKAILKSFHLWLSLVALVDLSVSVLPEGRPHFPLAQVCSVGNILISQSCAFWTLAPNYGYYLTAKCQVIQKVYCEAHIKACMDDIYCDVQSLTSALFCVLVQQVVHDLACYSKYRGRNGGSPHLVVFLHQWGQWLLFRGYYLYFNMEWPRKRKISPVFPTNHVKHKPISTFTCDSLWTLIASLNH